MTQNPSRWVTPPTQEFCVRYTNMLVSKNAKTPDAKPKICITPTPNPNASQWNIGCVGYQTQNFRIGHVHFMFFVLISFAFGGQRKPRFQWNMGFKPIFHCDAKPLALGPGVGLDPQRHTFASPNAKYTNMLVYFGVT